MAIGKKQYRDILNEHRRKQDLEHIPLTKLALLQNCREILTVHKLYKLTITPPALNPGLKVYFLNRNNDVEAATIHKVEGDGEWVWLANGFSQWRIAPEAVLFTPVPYKPTLVPLEDIDRYIPYGNAAQIWRGEQG